MLQVKNINKRYKTGDLEQIALNNVSLNLRDNEFVAILGPSGSGKTTFLNIIGGLDRYDSGDLIINGISTKKYKNKDWDSYRNHTIGFIFQSYNLIPHQTILSNVELALTIGGVSRDERKKRAQKALEQVGLGDQGHKKPNQMSGGQMQRVAIARALVNDPEILLADEPTGALDTKTSIQIMDLLKEVAQDRLVVMVTHNPDLAHQYANRIVELKDGRITSDSNPYEPKTTAPALNKNLGKASMSLLTSLSLSFNNLLTKKARTLLTSFAGSIGIIGIALILSLSNGVNSYILGIEEDTLSEYPLSITSSSLDISSMMGAAVGTLTEEYDTSEDTVYVTSIISNVFSRIGSNDLEAFTQFLESGESDIYDYVKAIEYDYDVTPLIYSADTSSIDQVNPMGALSAFSSITDSALMSSMSSMMSFNQFYQMPENEELFTEQYDVIAGRWPENYDEVVLVLGDNDNINDMMLYTLGLRDYDEFTNLVNDFMSGEDMDVPDTNGLSYSFDEILNITFKLVNASDCYKYDETYDIYVDKSDDDKFMRDVVENGEDIKIVGILRPNENATASMLSEGLAYPATLTDHVIEEALKSEPVQKQMENKSYNIFTGNEFGEDDDSSIDLSELFNIDEDALSDMFDFDMDDISLDMSGMDLSGMDFSGMDFSGMDLSGMDFSNMDFGDMSFNFDMSSFDMSSLDLSSAMTQVTIDTDALMNGVEISITDSQANELSENLINDFISFASDYDLNDSSDLSNALNAYSESESAQSIVSQTMSQVVEQSNLVDQVNANLNAQMSQYMAQYSAALTQQLTEALSSQMETMISSQMEEMMSQMMTSMMSSMTEQISSQMESQMSTMMESMMSSMTDQISDAISSQMSSLTDAFSFDPDQLSDAFDIDIDSDDLTSTLTSMFTSTSSTYEDNLSTLGYVSKDKPSSISIYPLDFENKEHVTDIIDGYNDQMQLVDEDKVISYTDYVGTLMSSVTTIIDTVSYVLIAFVAISLVVSSIMIGVITYISVLERNKEIGILRAMGASKRNISNVFNAETFIIGLLAGVLGIAITEILLIPGNMLIHAIASPNVSAILPGWAAIMLIVLSVVLTLIGGLIPSRTAANEDPVIALRSE